MNSVQSLKIIYILTPLSDSTLDLFLPMLLHYDNIILNLFYAHFMFLLHFDCILLRAIGALTLSHFICVLFIHVDLAFYGCNIKFKYLDKY